MTGWLFHRLERAQWLLYLTDGQLVKGRTKQATLLAGQRLGLDFYHYYAGRMGSAEIVMTVSDLIRKGQIADASHPDKEHE